MSEMEVYRPTATVPSAELDVITRQADLLAQSDIIPSAYRRKPANILVAALTGRTFGWDAMTAMRNGHVIEGTWSIKPEAMLALVRRAGHSVAGESTTEGATVTGRRSDTGDEMTVSFTLDDARRAGLVNKNTWKQYPQSMCWARAVSQLCRMLFADVTLGLSYTPEELGAEVDADGEPRPVPVLAAVPEPVDGRISADNAARLVGRCHGAGLDPVAVVQEATRGRTTDPAEVLTTEVAAVKGVMAEMVDAREAESEPEVVEVVEFEAADAIADAEIIEEAEPDDNGHGGLTRDDLTAMATTSPKKAKALKAAVQEAKRLGVDCPESFDDIDGPLVAVAVDAVA
jgi:hypothetical protein